MTHVAHNPRRTPPASDGFAARAIRRVLVLGATGSIGTQTLDVIEHLNARAAADPGATTYRVVGLAAGANADRLAELARRFGVRDVALADSRAPAASLPDELARAARGPQAAEQLVRGVEADLVVTAMVGAAGLPATLAALELGRDVALANKETLVAAGSLVADLIERAPAGRRPSLLPIDSEHSAVWQCLGGARGEDNPVSPPWPDEPRVSRVTLTASGGPFREWAADRVRAATPAEALRHPTWTMGGKITIDSATLMNKTLEMIEAHWLFSLGPDKLDVLVHPQSIVHALVETIDGSVLAQLGAPDMRTAIQIALTAPRRAPGLARRLDLAALRSLHFEPPDERRFPAVGLWRRCIGPDRSRTTAGAILNAANEAAVAAFLSPDRGRPLAFPRIAELAAAALDAIPARETRTLADVTLADAQAREFVARRTA
ncbi:MAG: 1-deoxy-D-xylulose-5-phosphate reductoisomerase [Phycisphaerae bacterium]|nr:1-deoxy-D-xylulose-5-phosphate reductoisomerase [Phycisphaerae bacterium]